jgi:hypothetical protein
MDLTPLHINLAKIHWKRMWSTDSSRPQRPQFPSEAPPRDLIRSFEGRRPLQLSQVKILILRESLGCQINLVTGSWGLLQSAR